MAGVPHMECITAALKNGTVDPRETTLALRERIAELDALNGVAERLNEPRSRTYALVAKGLCTACLFTFIQHTRSMQTDDGRAINALLVFDDNPPDDAVLFTKAPCPDCAAELCRHEGGTADCGL